MKTELALLEVSENNYPKIYCVGGLDAFYEKSKAEVAGEVPDLSTRKGRDRIATLAADVSRSKVAVETPGRAYNKFLKAQPKLIDKELREFCDKMDRLRDDTRAPLTAWEVIDNAGKQQVIDVAAYLIKFDADVEEGYRDNELFDFKLAQAEADRQAEIERATIKAAAEAKAKAEQEAAAEIERVKREKQEALDRVFEAGIRREKAEREAVEAQERMKYVAEQAERDRIKLEQQAKQDAFLADQRAKYEAEQAENRRAEAEQQAIRDAQTAAENARLAEVQRQQEAIEREAKKKAKLEADKNHTAAINRAVMADFISIGLDKDSAMLATKALAAKKIRYSGINY